MIESLRTEGWAGAVLQYVGNGALAMVVYASLVGTLRSVFELYDATLTRGEPGRERREAAYVLGGCQAVISPTLDGCPQFSVACG